MLVLSEKLREVFFSVLPITILVLIIHFFITPIDKLLLLRFIIGTIMIILGLTTFLFGVDIGITQIGKNIGKTIAKTNKVYLVGMLGIILGFFISIAEPDLHIVARQINDVTNNLISKNLIVIVVSIGIAVMVAIGLLRIIFNFSLNILLTIIYLIILILSFFTSPEFLAISFDASGATTGAMTVPFILALSLGVSFLKTKKGTQEEDSFGLVGIASTGAIIAVLFMSIIKPVQKLSTNLNGNLKINYNLLQPFLNEIPTISKEIIIALIPLIITFIFFQIYSFKLSKKIIKRIIKGLVYTFIGLVLFLTGVNAGFMEVGNIVGYKITKEYNSWLVIIIGFILGTVTVIAEPAVYVLTKQIEDVTSGSIKKIIVLITLSFSIGIAISLSMIRIIIPQVSLWHYLLPGYIIAIILSFLIPKVFVGIAFDAGGVASGPITATFILAFAHGVAHATEEADILVDGFGMIAMVALMPLIVLQLLGLIYKIKLSQRGN